MGYNQPYSATWAPNPDSRLFERQTILYGQVYAALGAGERLVTLYPHERIDGGDVAVEQAFLDAEARNLLPEKPVIVTRDPEEDIAVLEVEIDLRQTLTLSALETQCKAIQVRADRRAGTIAGLKEAGLELARTLGVSAAAATCFALSALGTSELLNRHISSDAAEVLLRIAEFTWIDPLIDSSERDSPLYRQFESYGSNDTYVQGGGDPDKLSDDAPWYDSKEQRTS